MKLLHRSRRLALALLLAGSPALRAAPAGTAISYQGRLNDGGVPADGSYEFRFTLHDDATAGAQVGPARTNAPVAVAGGDFTTAIDFGAGAFNGDARWLEIAVRPAGSDTAFTPLAPRQGFSPVPYALHALQGEPPSNGSNLTNVPTTSLTGKITPNQIAEGSLSGSLFFDGAITGQQIANGALSPAHLNTGAFGTANIQFGSVKAGSFDGPVAASQLIGQITPNQIAEGSLSGSLFFDGAITGQQIANGALSPAHLNGGAFGTANIQFGSVKAGSFDGPVAASQLTGKITPNQIAEGSLSGSLFFDGAITGQQIANGALSPAHLNTGAFGTANIQFGSVKAGSFDGPIAADQITGKITPSQIIEGSLSGSLFSDGAITGQQIANGAILPGHLSPSVLTGLTGPKGDKGDTGATGPGGPPGVQGVAGATGPAGPKGDKGDPGDPGAVGPQGLVGPTGPQGPQGIPGSSDGWSRTGNAGTTDANFLGTTDNRPVELRVNGSRALRLEPTGTDGAVNVVGGSRTNRIGNGAVGATIGGGGAVDYVFEGEQTGGPNVVEADFGTVDGGLQNRVLADSIGGVIGGGGFNVVSNALAATIGGGQLNLIQTESTHAVIGGGVSNIVHASAGAAVIGGGVFNEIGANAVGAMVPGGTRNVAAGPLSFAAGRQAKANHHGTFVWGDSTEADFASTGVNQFLIRAGGGVAIGTNDPAGAALRVAGTIKADAFEGPLNLSSLGTAGQTLDLTVNGVRGLRIQDATGPVDGAPALIGGYHGNTIGGGAHGAVIAGGGRTDAPNSIGSNLAGAAIGGGMGNAITDGGSASVIDGGSFNRVMGTSGNGAIGGGQNNTVSNAVGGVIGGGRTNTVSAKGATVGGGLLNLADGELATIGGGGQNVAGSLNTTVGGGGQNTASAQGATVGGGLRNTASGLHTTVSGGTQNTASAGFATVPGGLNNAATANYTLAAGRGAKAGHKGTFVWADSPDTVVTVDFNSTADNQFLIRATGGVAIGTNDPAGAALRVAGPLKADGLSLTPAEGTIRSVVTASINVIGGSSLNSVGPGVIGATIAGGGASPEPGSGGGGPFSGAARAAIGRSAASETPRQNQVLAHFGTVGGGYQNRAQQPFATIAGGAANVSDGTGAAIAGGHDNTARADYGAIGGGIHNRVNATNGVVAGGLNNHADGPSSTIGGGQFNLASGFAATVPGGSLNQATAPFAFAAGEGAIASHPGTFVWADSGGSPFESTKADQFLIKAGQGVGINTASPSGALSVATPSGTVSIVDETFTPALVMKGGPVPGTLRVRDSIEIWGSDDNDVRPGKLDLRTAAGAQTISLNGGNGQINAFVFNPSSDRNVKENFAPVNPQEVLAKVAALPISRWNYKVDREPRHLGPMAQDFHAAFGLGADDKHIATVDADGVAFAAIQGLNEKVESEVTALRAENAALKERLERLERLLSQQNGGGQ